MSTGITARGTDHGAIRLVAVAHLAFAGAFALVVAVYLIRTALAAPDPLYGASDPKDMVPFGDHLLNPFIWVYGVLSLLYLTGPLLSPALLIVSTPLLALRWRGSGRTVRWLLVAGMLAAVALPLVRFSPFDDDLHRWWLD